MHGMKERYDVIVVGGGIAGLSAALVLGRCRRSVLVCDHGKPRNRVAREVHAFFSRDGIPPMELRKIARQQLETYPHVEIRDVEVTDASECEEGYEVLLADASIERGRKLLLATGLRDELPPIERIHEFYGTSVHHCPICDAWEHRDQRIVVYGKGRRAAELAIEMLAWTSAVVLCSNGPAELTKEQGERLARHGIAVHEERVLRFEGDNGLLQRLILEGGPPVELEAFFFAPAQQQGSGLPIRLGCRLNPELKEVRVAATSEVVHRPGLYVVGNASEGTQLAVIAAAEAASAAHTINSALNSEDFP
jgi:thioredoxin reductase